MKSLFISDTHFAERRPQAIDYFLIFIKTLPQRCDQLFLLGDFFDIWIGNDHRNDSYRRLVEGLHELSSRLPVSFMRGNHDFLVDDTFAANTGCRILDDVHIEVLDGTPVLLLHGDLLCTDDHDYQRLRRVLRSAFIRWLADHSSLGFREWLANRLAKISKQANVYKAPEIMDVNQQEVETYFLRYDVDCMIHGHTHRPHIHNYELNSRARQRIVLGDWYSNRGKVLFMEDGKPRLETLQIDG